VIHHKLVLPEFMNHQGSLFGGYLLKWIDEVAFMTANLDYPGNRFVTVGLDDVTFRHRIDMGEILQFRVEESRRGASSLEYNVRVVGTREPAAKDRVLFETNITFVSIDESGDKQAIGTDA